MVRLDRVDLLVLIARPGRTRRSLRTGRGGEWLLSPRSHFLKSFRRSLAASRTCGKQGAVTCRATYCRGQSAKSWGAAEVRDLLLEEDCFKPAENLLHVTNLLYKQGSFVQIHWTHCNKTNKIQCC